ncbi:Large neutral amino acids transporter small subunit 2 [Thelohanellus kitauei]|uniref:Large neutral amino acids transporter small subunit 2 n=1 Tax=Thelohanellus kitauei TaxID=669202 RepID=A0A0C2MM99_THEKT|nr:Large neutral amino acids transporter small subunit 2 [Thelohanellus kitauei]
MDDATVDIIDVEKPMGLFGATSFLFCSMIGTGIFISVSETFKVFSSNNILVVLVIWIFGGLISLIGSLCYAELGVRYPKTGGEVVYFGEILGEKFGVLFVVMYVFVVKSITLAALALTAAKYLVNSFEFNDILFVDKCTKMVALSVLLVTFLVNCFSRKFITKFLNVFSFFKLISMAVIISAGIYTMIKGIFSN